MADVDWVMVTSRYDPDSQSLHLSPTTNDADLAPLIDAYNQVKTVRKRDVGTTTQVQVAITLKSGMKIELAIAEHSPVFGTTLTLGRYFVFTVIPSFGSERARNGPVCKLETWKPPACAVQRRTQAVFVHSAGSMPSNIAMLGSGYISYGCEWPGRSAGWIPPLFSGRGSSHVGKCSGIHKKKDHKMPKPQFFSRIRVNMRSLGGLQRNLGGERAPQIVIPLLFPDPLQDALGKSSGIPT
jgi:hypothetical protein